MLGDEQVSALVPAFLGMFIAVVITAALYIFYPAYEASGRPRVVGSTVRNFCPKNAPIINTQDLDKPVLLSLVIPAYNEESRLLNMLEATQRCFAAKACPGLEKLARETSKSTEMVQVEWIVVNDGSTDKTSGVFERFVLNHKPCDKRMIWRLCSLSKNSGKGAAVQAGMLVAKGKYRLMVDADGATDFGPGLEAVAQHIDKHDFVFGSRASSGGDGVQRSLVRQILQAGFHAFVVLVVGYSHVQDTQCGFKLFTGKAAPELFGGLHLHRWAFDTELFLRARLLGLEIKEVPVPWQEIEGSKLNTSTFNLIRVAVGMLRDMICVRLCYTLGIWSIGEPSKKDR